MGRVSIGFLVALFLLHIFAVEGGFLSSFFGSKKNEAAGADAAIPKFEHYREILPYYWKEPPCAKPLPVVDRYLLMSKRNGGWNNERMILENAIIFAWLTNRTLVIPHQLRYDHMHGEETFEKFVNLSYARCFVPIIDSSELPRLTNNKVDERFHGVEYYSEASTFDIEFNNAAFAYPEVPTVNNGATYDDYLECEAFRTGRPVIHQLVQSDGEFEKLSRSLHMEDVKVEYLENTHRFLNSKSHFFCLYYAFFWFQDKAVHNQMIEIIKQGTRFQEKFWDAALAVLQDLGPPGEFSTIHLRSRDFRQKTGYYQYFKSRSWIDNFREHHSSTFLPKEKVYISTDERNMTEIKEFQKQLNSQLGVQSSTIYDFFDTLNIDQTIGHRRWEFWGSAQITAEQASRFNLNDLGAIEQIVCAHGRRFIATYFSTFSAHIVRLRGYLPFENVRTDEHLFWDRTLTNEGRCTWDSIPEHCEPSWQGQFRGAMWASEYAEGWMTYEDVKRTRKDLSPEDMLPNLKHGRRFSKAERDKFESQARLSRRAPTLAFPGGKRLVHTNLGGEADFNHNADEPENNIAKRRADRLARRQGKARNREEIFDRVRQRVNAR